MIAGLLLLLGVCLICRPPFLFDCYEVEEDGSYYFGLMLAASGCVCTGVMSVLVVKCHSVTTTTLMLWTGWLGLVIAVTFCLIYPASDILSSRLLHISTSHWAIYIGERLQWPPPDFSLTTSGLAVSGLIGFTSVTKSLQLISPTLVNSIRSLELIIAFTVQTILTSQSPDLVSSLGGIIIITGVLMVAFQDNIVSATDKLMAAIKEQLPR